MYDLELCTIGFAANGGSSVGLKYNNGLSGHVDVNVGAAVSYCVGSKALNALVELKLVNGKFKFDASIK